MAKRYKKQKINKTKMVIFLIVIISTILIFISIRNIWFKNSNIQNDEPKTISDEKVYEIVEKKETLTSDILNPRELDNEICSKFSDILEGGYIIKIHYKLNTLEDGNIDVYYKVNGKIFKILVDIENKMIDNIEENKDDYLISKGQITNNIEENIEEDFNKRKKDLENENFIVNIIITDTEVVINTSLK